MTDSVQLPRIQNTMGFTRNGFQQRHGSVGRQIVEETKNRANSMKIYTTFIRTVNEHYSSNYKHKKANYKLKEPEPT